MKIILLILISVSIGAKGEELPLKKKVAKLIGHKASIASLAFSPDG